MEDLAQSKKSARDDMKKSLWSKSYRKMSIGMKKMADQKLENKQNKVLLKDSQKKS